MFHLNIEHVTKLNCKKKKLKMNKGQQKLPQLLAVYPSSNAKNNLNLISKKANVKIDHGSMTTHGDLAIFDIKQKGDLNKLIKGNIVNDKNNTILCCPIDGKNAPLIFEQMQNEFPKRIKEGSDLVDLSHVQTKPPMYLSGRYIIFFAAIYCAKNKMLQNIKRMSLEGNSLRDTKLITNIKDFFPNLEYVSFAKNRISQAVSPKEGPLILLDSNDPLFTGEDNSEMIIYPPLPPSQYEYNEKGPLSMQIPLNVRPGNPFETPQEQLSLSDIQRETIDTDDLLNSHITRYFKMLKTDMGQITKFYSPTAVFTITVEDSPPDSPLQKYMQFSRNLLRDISLNNICQGQIQIAEAHFLIWGDYLESSITDYCVGLLYPGLFTVSMVFYFEDCDGNVIASDRTMVVGYDGTDMLIVNDHLHLRLPKV